jgi:hypothetical protein
METGNITVTLTESQHEMMVEVLTNAQEAFNFAIPSSESFASLTLDNEIVQRQATLDTLQELFFTLWVDRFEPSEYAV